VCVSAISVRSCFTVSPVAVASAPTVMGMTTAAAAPSSDTCGPVAREPVKVSSAGIRRLMPVRSAVLRAAPSVRVATRITGCWSASGNSASRAATWPDSESAGSTELPSGAFTIENRPNNAVNDSTAITRAMRAPRREVSAAENRWRAGEVSEDFNMNPVHRSAAAKS